MLLDSHILNPREFLVIHRTLIVYGVLLGLRVNNVMKIDWNLDEGIMWVLTEIQEIYNTIGTQYLSPLHPDISSFISILFSPNQLC